MRASRRPAWLAVVAASMRKPCPLYCSQFRRPLARRVCWSSSTNLSRVRGCPDNPKSGRSQSGIPVDRACNLSSPSRQMSHCAASPTVSSHAPSERVCLRRRYVHRQCVLVELDVIPLECKQLAASHKGEECKRARRGKCEGVLRVPRVRSCLMIIRSTGRVTGRRCSSAWVPGVRLMPRKT